MYFGKKFFRVEEIFEVPCLHAATADVKVEMRTFGQFPSVSSITDNRTFAILSLCNISRKMHEARDDPAVSPDRKNRVDCLSALQKIAGSRDFAAMRSVNGCSNGHQIIGSEMEGGIKSFFSEFISPLDPLPIFQRISHIFLRLSLGKARLLRNMLLISSYQKPLYFSNKRGCPICQLRNVC